MADLNSADILGVDWARRARELLAGARTSVPKEKTPPEMWRGGTFRLEPVEIREKNVLTDPESWLNRGIGTILENSVDAILGEGTGNTALDMALGMTGPGAAVGTVAAGNKPGLLDVLPGSGALKAGILGLVKAGRRSEAKAIYNILQNPIANRFANRYPEEALQSLEKFIKKHPALKTMNTAEVYDAMGSGRLGGEWFVDLSKDYPEAFKLIHSTTEPLYHMSDGDYLSQREMADYLGGIFGKEYSGPLHNMLDEVDRLVERGDYTGATARLSTLGETMIAMSNISKDNFYKQFNTGEVFEKKLKEAASLPLSVKEETAPVVKMDPATASQSQKDAGDLVNEYIHLQIDPMGNWSRIADIDDKAAADIAQYGSLQAAEKARRAEQARLTMERKAASEAARQSRQYQQRLHDFNKNPKKALKTANSAAPKQIRAQGESAVREWYFGVDPMAPKSVEATPAQEILKIVDEPPNPTPVTPVQHPEPVNPVITEVPKEPVVQEPPKGGPNKWRENGWTSEEHPIDAYSILNPKATEEDRRAMFVFDSLANEAVAKLIRNNKFKNEWPGQSTFRHEGTNYDIKSSEFGRNVAWNARTGNIPDNTSSLVLRTAVSSAGNRLPGQMTGFVDGNDLYNLLFRKKVNKKIHELDNRYPDYF